MCGIAGIVNFGGEPVDRARVERMTEALAHRGPDGSGVWIEGHVGFGHRRLAIRDLSPAGAQPMIDAQAKIAVTYNGELYNDLDIRPQLTQAAGTQFHTCCDTEVIAPAYRQWGRDAFLKFEGIYAMALWDQANQRLILARDPVGIKPLYFSFVGRSLRFASEIKSLLALDDQPRKLSPQSLHRFFAQGFPGPSSSLIDGIVPVPPGSLLIADRDGWRIEKFWQPQRRPKITDLDEALDAFDRLWPRVVGDQLISDVPVSLLLSGGIDSALIATALPKRSDLSVYTATFGEAAFDESGLATKTAQHAGLQQNFVSIDTEADIEARFLDVVAKVDGQLAEFQLAGVLFAVPEGRQACPRAADRRRRRRILCRLRDLSRQPPDNGHRAVRSRASGSHHFQSSVCEGRIGASQGRDGGKTRASRRRHRQRRRPAASAMAALSVP